MFLGAVWVYLLQTKDNQEFHSPKTFDTHYSHIDSMLNHSGSSGETNGDRCLVGSVNGGTNSYPSSANSSILPWCSNGAESNFQSSHLQEKSHTSPPNSNVERERGKSNESIGGCSSFTHNSEHGKQFSSCVSSPANIAHKEHNAAKYSSSQNFALRTEEEDLIQKVSDVMKMEQCDKVIKTAVDNGHHTSSSTSSNRSQKSSESSNSFYASIRSSGTSTQPAPYNPVISLMLSNNQPPLQLHNRVSSGLQTANLSELNNEKLAMLDKLKRRENGLPQTQPTYANFLNASAANDKRLEPAHTIGDQRRGYLPGIYAVSFLEQ